MAPADSDYIITATLVSASVFTNGFADALRCVTSQCHNCPCIKYKSLLSGFATMQPCNKSYLACTSAHSHIVLCWLSVRDCIRYPAMGLLCWQVLLAMKCCDQVTLLLQQPLQSFKQCYW